MGSEKLFLRFRIFLIKNWGIHNSSNIVPYIKNKLKETCNLLDQGYVMGAAQLRRSRKVHIREKTLKTGLLSFFISLSLIANEKPNIPETELIKLRTECANKMFSSCYYLGLIKERQEAFDEANTLLKTACDNGVSAGCHAIKKMALAQLGENGNVYKRIQFRTLSNGLKVGLLKSTLTNQVLFNLKVDAGMINERSNEIGVAHLTEHAIFQDPLMARESYMDELQRHGARANAHTTLDRTVYFTTLPASELNWFIPHLRKMFGPRTFTDSMIDKSRKIIDIEGDSRGAYFLRFSTSASSFFYKSEYGLNEKGPSMLEYFRHGSLRTTADVQTFFESHYHPKNMRLYLVGNFEEDAVFEKLEDALKDLSSNGKATRKEAIPRLRNKPHHLAQITPSAPRIVLGTKLWKITPQDELILRAYLRDLSSRLQSQLRSEEAHTYTVQNEIEMDSRNFGRAQIAFEAPGHSFDYNFEYAKKMIQNETRGPGLEEKDYLRIKNSYLDALSSSEQDLNALMSTLQWVDFFQDTFKLETTPYQVLENITAQQMQVSLKKLFTKERNITVLLYPPLFFKLDTLVLFLFSFLLATMASRFYFRSSQTVPSKRFRVSYSGLGYASFFILFFVGVVIVGAAEQRVWLFLRNYSDFVMNRVLFCYVYQPFFNFFGCLALCYLTSFILRSFWLDDQFLVLMGAFGRRTKIPINEIEEVTAKTPFFLLTFPPWKLRVFYFSLFLRKGLLVKLRNGKCYFMGAEDPQGVADQLNGCVQPSPSISMERKAG